MEDAKAERCILQSWYYGRLKDEERRVVSSGQTHTGSRQRC